MLGLRNRVVVPEVMDQPDLDPSSHQLALAGLARLNRLSRVPSTIWRSVSQVLDGSKALSVLDLGCASGDVVLGLHQRALSAGVRLRIEGWDSSPVAIDQATRAAERLCVPACFRVRDVLIDELPSNYDVVMSNLLIHHLDDADAVRLLDRMGRAAGRLVVVDDLVRGPAGYLLALAGTRVLSRSSIVHTDGPRSVRAAFKPAEVVARARSAGLRRVRIRRHWPRRYLLLAAPR